jgi:ABC-type lipoprotein export system ATPase subunit
LPEAIVTCRRLSKTYLTAGGAIEALRGVDTAFALGEITAVVGSSGSGKSTLLRALAGLDRPTSGELVVEGRSLGAASGGDLREHRRHRVTYVSQKPADNFIPHLTLDEHAHDEPGLARDLLVDVGLADRLASRPIELSGGEQARAAFALALARRTPLVVVDEPTAELDGASAGLLLDAMQRHASAGAAFVIATHDPAVTVIADCVLRLERGRVVEGDPASPEYEPPTRRTLDAEPVVVETRSLAKSYRHGGEVVHAVRDAGLGLRRGELGVLLGRSGSGKSTLLTLLAGWQSPDHGELLWHGRPPTSADRGWARLGYLPQRFGLIPELTVRENVELPLRLAGTWRQSAERVDALLERLGLDELAHRRPPESSIGQQQRTALARALVLRPELLVVDEPSSHQDAGWHDAVWALLAQAAAEGTACLAATHELEAARYATRVWQMDEGVADLDR